MPGELKDPEQSIPFHYDPKYDQVPGANQPGARNTDGYIESIIMENLGIRVSPEKMEMIIEKLDDKGFFHRNPGSQEFRDEVVKLTKRFVMAGRVARKCLILIN